MPAKPGNIDEYLAAVDAANRGTLEKTRAAIRALAPPETTETIAYGMPVFVYKGKLIGFAAFSKHWSLFPMDGSLITELRDDLSAYETSKGAIRIPAGQTVPAPLLKKIVRACVARNEAAKPRKKARPKP